MHPIPLHGLLTVVGENEPAPLLFFFFGGYVCESILLQKLQTSVLVHLKIPLEDKRSERCGDAVNPGGVHVAPRASH